MGVCAWSSWKKSAETQLRGIFFAITKHIVQCMSRPSQGILSSRNYWSHVIYRMSGWRLNLTWLQVLSMMRKSFSAGVGKVANCLKKIGAVIVPKKNTQICRLSVLSGAIYRLRRGHMLIPIVACFAKSVNRFAERYCYV